MRTIFIFLLFSCFVFGVKAQLCFNPPIIYPTSGSSPLEGDAADFNEDGILDFVTADQYNGLSLFVGSGSGNFLSPINISVGLNPGDVVCADFNLDGHIDIASANMNSVNISVLLGNGNGTFGTPTNYPAGSGASGLVTADFNSDGYLDFAVTSLGNNTVAILLGASGGVFSSPVTYPTGSQPCKLVCDDFNSDSKLDLMITNQNTGSLSFLKGQGNGTFIYAANIATGNSWAYHIVTGDFNNDGLPDVAVTHSSSSVDVAVLFGNGLGNFSSFVYAYQGVAGSIAINDFNSDGNMDLAISGGNQDSLIIVLGDGLGSFSQGIKFFAGGSTLNFCISRDFNNDLKPDIVALNMSLGKIHIILNCSSTSIGFEDYSLSKKQIIYPNPSSGYFRISNLEVKNCYVISNLGKQERLNLVTTADGAEINAELLEAGCYTLLIESETEMIYYNITILK